MRSLTKPQDSRPHLLEWVFILIIVSVSLLTGCGLVVSDRAPMLVESDSALVAHCDDLGTLTKVVRNESWFGYASGYQARQDVMTRGVRLGATHIVWLYTSGSGAIAKVYRCPEIPAAASWAIPIDSETVAPNPAVP